ncbi:KilA-N domain-containing protein [Pontibacter chinhatensis]|uniref:KilA-N domain-containing protein n=1 Tax=Pontibacter chinhatensis TaxID=1436961 RepID=A0A1I2VE27_9BACT|nr:KilA-N domain-containing protein [Pontibacter chinhatensis]SFG87420.1 KilA-N domain-containing protein [Pontibacter chinhatensis]
MNELNVRQDAVNDFEISLNNSYGEIPFCLVEEDMVEADFMESRFKHKKIRDFIKKEHVKEFMHELSSEILGPALVKRHWGPDSETWMHKILALKYAAWLNPSFELWVYKQVEKLLSAEHNLKWEDLVLQIEE